MGPMKNGSDARLRPLRHCRWTFCLGSVSLVTGTRYPIRDVASATRSVRAHPWRQEHDLEIRWSSLAGQSALAVIMAFRRGYRRARTEIGAL